MRSVAVAGLGDVEEYLLTIPIQWLQKSFLLVGNPYRTKMTVEVGVGGF